MVHLIKVLIWVRAVDNEKLGKLKIVYKTLTSSSRRNITSSVWSMPRFVPRERKHKKIARNKSISDSNTNSETIIPESQSERETRRDALREQIRAQQPESKSSSKKKKRLEKYIDIKLKKEENAELIRKLEAQKVDTGLLQSSKTLGRTRESQREKFSRALREQQAGIGDGAALLEERRDVEVENPEEEGSDASDGASAGAVVVDAKAPSTNAAMGTGLKRPLEIDDSGQPVIKKRKKRGDKRPAIQPVFEPSDDDEDDAEDDAEEWEGFSSDGEPLSGSGSELGSGSVSASESESESESTPESEPEADVESKPRKSAFKAWADSLRNSALDFTPSTAAPNDEAARANFKPRQPSPDPLMNDIPNSKGQELQSKPAPSISIPRSDEVQAARLELPIVQEEQKIMEKINSCPVVVICGATGSGKTTQIPQMLLENGYASNRSSPKEAKRGVIGITQPRRVAATSVAARVQHELGSDFGKNVAHQVRYDTNMGKDTAIKFMTDGILLREIQSDFVLSKYSVIVLDEAHERSVNTDILIGMLARIVPLRSQLAKEDPEKYSPLKLIIMSATLSQSVGSFLKNVKLWQPLGGPPPILEIEGRQYPVTVHFARKTRLDYEAEVVEKVARGHKKLPPGAMLVFLTGQQEIQNVMRKLKAKIGGAGAANGFKETQPEFDEEDGFGVVTHKRHTFLEGEEESSDADSDAEAEIKLDDEDNEFSIPADPAAPTSKEPLKPQILPLYAALPPTQQLKVFQPPPPGTRLIVLATNVAETSLTIPGIRYVIDSGRVKEKRYNTSTGVQTFEVDLISKASAEQRKGRAGRTGPGHVWRLYSSNLYEEFMPGETVPEVLRTPLESVVLQLKGMEIENVGHFPFPTQPDPVAVVKAEAVLKNLGIIDKKRVTSGGKEAMGFPVGPRLGKMLALALRNGMVVHAVALVAGLAVGDVFVPEAQGAANTSQTKKQGNEPNDGSEDGEEEDMPDPETEKRHQVYTRAQAKLSSWDDKSDTIKLLTAVASYAQASSSGENLNSFCKDLFLTEKSLREVQLLRRQLHSILSKHSDSTKPIPDFTDTLPLPTDKEVRMLNQIVATGYIDQVAIRSDLLPPAANASGFGRSPRRAIEVAYRTLIPSIDDSALSTITDPVEKEIMRSVFVHPSSVLARLSPKEMPDYVVYSHLSRAAPSSKASGGVTKTRFHALAPTTPKVLAVLAEGTPLLRFGKPIGKVEEMGRDAKGAQRRQCWVGVGLKAEGGKFEWPLTQWKVVQKRGGRDWEVETVVAR